MELRRLSRALSGRWATVIAIGLVGVIAALAFTSISNRTPGDTVIATAAIRFEPDEGQTIADLAPEIEAARGFAIIAAEEQILADPDIVIEADLGGGRLVFTTQAPSQAEAARKAAELVDAFNQIDPTLGGQVDDEMESLRLEAASIADQLQALEDQLSQPDPQDVLLAERLDSQINGINQRLGELDILEAGADAETRAAIILERANLNNLLAETLAEREALGDVEPAQLSPGDLLLQQTLQNRLTSIASEFERLYLRQQGVEGIGVLEPTTFSDLNSAPANAWVNAAVGFLGGVLIAVFALMFLARTRRTVLLPEDVAVPVLGSIPSREVGFSLPDRWYDEAEGGPRKTAIQALRSSVEALVPMSGETIAISRHAAPGRDVQGLAVDLASSLATAGTSVLVIDADWHVQSQIGASRVGGETLASVLALDPAAPEYPARVDHAAESAHLIRNGLSVLPSGTPPASAADALAGRQFRALLSAAQDRYDVVIVVVDAIESPAAQVAMQRVNHALVVVTPGSTTMPDLNGHLEDLHRLRVSVLGAVFLSKHDRVQSFFRSRSAGKSTESSSVAEAPSAAPPKKPKSSRRKKEEEGPPPPSPISRLQNYPIPDERRTGLLPQNTLRDLADEISPMDMVVDEGSLGDELLAVLSTSANPQAYPAVAEYLVARIEDMVTAQHGLGDLSPELVDQVAEDGFVSLRALRGHRTAGSWLRQEIEREAGEFTADNIISQMERILGGGIDEEVSIDEWLIKEFFKRHLAKTEGQPSIWHLTGPGQAVDILVPARRLNSERLSDILRNVVSNGRDEMVRFRHSAMAHGDHEQAGLFDTRIAEFDRFESALQSVATGKYGKTEAWEPDWTKGTRSNLAVFQDAGLIPFPVLSQQEMDATLVSA